MAIARWSPPVHPRFRADPEGLENATLAALARRLPVRLGLKRPVELVSGSSTLEAMNDVAENDVSDRSSPADPSRALEKQVGDIGRPSTAGAWLNANLALCLKGRHGESLTLELTIGATIVGLVALLAWLGR